MNEELKQENSKDFGLPKIGTKEFNNLASGLFGGKPKQETVEEAAEVYANKKGDIPTTKLEDVIFKQGFIDGAKWQMDKQSDFIIRFLEFIEGTYSYSNIFDHWYLHSDTSKTYSKKQLLEIYLKRNKLWKRNL